MSSTVHNNSNIMSVKGHLVTKSSALSTGNSKLESQFITAQNMASHYKRVINAKSAINTLPPKSITCSQKARDRARREMKSYSAARQSFTRTKSAESPRNSVSISTADKPSVSQSRSIVYRDTINRNIVVQEVVDPKPLPDQQKLMKSMSNLMTNFTKNRTGNTMPVPTVSLSATKSENTFAKNFDFMGDKTKNVLANFLMHGKKNDDVHSSTVFQSNPALKAMSKLVAGHHYDVLDNHAGKFSHPTKTFQPRIKNTKASSNLAQKSSYYQPPRRRRKSQPTSVNGSVQSVKQSNLQRSFVSEKKQAIREDASLHELTSDSDLDRSHIEHGKVMNRSSNTKRIPSPMEKSFDNKMKLEKEAQKEEELKYLEFIKEVTNDVISRGISSNRVINTCFEYHINKNKDRLDQNKMQDLLESLRKDIGITEENHVQTPSNYTTLQKLGYSNLQASQRRNSAASLNSNKRNSGSNDLSNTYELQIAQNIQSIRRNSLSSKSSEENLKKESGGATPGGFVRNNSGGSRERNLSSRRSSSESKRSGSPVPRRTSILKKTSFSSEGDKEDEYDGNVASDGKHLNESRPRSNISVKHTPIVREDDDLFDDDYGALEDDEDEDGEIKLKQESQEDSDDDDFDSMLKTKSFSNSRSKLAQATNRSNFDDENNRISREAARATTPRPVPRNSNEMKHNAVSDSSEDDEY